MHGRVHCIWQLYNFDGRQQVDRWVYPRGLCTCEGAHRFRSFASVPAQSSPLQHATCISSAESAAAFMHAKHDGGCIPIIPAEDPNSSGRAADLAVEESESPATLIVTWLHALSEAI